MNSIFRIVWSVVRGQSIVTSELASRHGKSRDGMIFRALLVVCVTAGLASFPLAQAYQQAGGNDCTTGTNDSRVAIGASAKACHDDSVALGSDAKATAGNTVAIGAASAQGDGDVAIGEDAIASGGGLSAIAVGFKANATGADALAFGNTTEATADFATALGNYATADSRNALSVGNSAASSGVGASSLGNFAKADGANATALGGGGQPRDVGGVFQGAQALADGATAIGGNQVRGAKASGVDSIAIGGEAISSAVNALAVGTRAEASGKESIAIGYEASATSDDSVALGRGSIADGTSLVDPAFVPVDASGDPIPGVKAQTANSEVSVGAAGSERRITNVAAGAGDTDAVNVSQLKAVDGKVKDVEAVANAGWNLSAQDGAASKVAPGGEVNLRNEDGNLAINQVTNNGREEVTFDLADDVTIGNELTVEGDTIVKGDTFLGDDFSVVNNEAHYSGDISEETHIVNKEYVDSAGDELVTRGLNFAGNEGIAVHRDLGDTLKISGEAATPGNYSGANLKTVTDPDSGAIKLELADSPKFGNVTINEGDGGKITGVADGTIGEGSKDAVNGGQLWTTQQSITDLQNTQLHYYSVNDGGTQGGNYDNDGATGLNAIAAGVDAQATSDGAVALGYGAQAGHENSVALGSNSITAEAQGTPDVTVAGKKYMFAGADPVGTLSIGSPGAERTITNVAAGRISDSSTDAINGSQLYATNMAVEAVDGRVDAVEGDVTQIGDQVSILDGRVTNVEGDVNNISNDLAELDGRAVKYDINSDSSVNYESITLEGDNGTTITNVAQGDVSQGSTDAVNGSQLWGVQNQISNISEGGTRYFKANSEAADARAEGAESVAMGPRSVTSGDNSVAAGNGAVSKTQGSVALGAGSLADREGMNGKKEAFSNTAVASRLGAVSVGSSGGERQIINVAGGTQASDAVNVRQMRAVQAGAVNYDRNDDGSVNYGSVTLNKGGNSTQIHNVAAGVAPTDAANVGQLQGLNQRFYNEIGSVNKRIDKVERNANAGIAGVAAMGNAPYVPGKFTYHVGGGHHSGESAVGINFRRTADNGRWSLTAGAAGSRAGATVSLGVSGVIN